MPLGDSITYGYGDPTFAGYRGPLGSLLAARAATVNFVGSQLAGPGSIDRDNEGHAGLRTDELATSVSTWLAAEPAALVLLLAGTNDIVQGYTSTENRIGSLIDAIASASPTSKILVSTLPPFTDAGFQTERHRVNTALAPVVPAHGGILVDAGDLVIATDLVASPDPNAGHPNTTGYGKMADDWNAAMQANGY